MFKRFIAYLIDLIIVIIVCSTINGIFQNKKISDYNHELNSYNEQMLNHKIEFGEYVSDYVRVSYKIDKEQKTCSCINIMIFILYFIIIPILTKGYTIGLKIMKLKLSGKIGVRNLFRRNIITTGILYMILSILIIHIFNYKHYFILMSILSFIQFLLVIISIFMIIYRGDKKGLQDVLSNTFVEEVK